MIVGGLFGSTTASAVENSVSFVTDPEKDGGYLIEITKEAFKRVGYTVKVDYQPWARALAGVMDGTNEALLGAQRTDERAAKMEYTETIGQSDMVFFALKKSNIRYDGLESLKGLTVGVVRNSVVTPAFDSASFIKKEEAPDFLTNVKKLLAERVQLVAEKRAVVVEALRKSFPDSADAVVALDPPIKTLKFYNCFSKKAPDYQKKVKDFNKGLDLMTQDGALKAILAKGLHE